MKRRHKFAVIDGVWFRDMPSLEQALTYISKHEGVWLIIDGHEYLPRRFRDDHDAVVGRTITGMPPARGSAE